jgi:hypothetical protein
MWLPTQVYEFLPTIYIVIGLTLLAGAVYIGAHSMAPIYFAFGVISVVSGLIVGQRRLLIRRSKLRTEDNYQA